MINRAKDIVPYSLYAKHRDAKGVTDYAVAQATSVTTAALTNWKQGTYAPKEDKLIEIARFLGIPFSALYAIDTEGGE